MHISDEKSIEESQLVNADRGRKARFGTDLFFDRQTLLHR